MQKRKSESDPSSIPAFKKLRYEKESLGSEHQNGKSLLPPLPPIREDLYKTVFTHQSQAPNKPGSQTGSYERLEFIGDAYIELMATRLIWDKFKDLPAGRLSQIRELLVKNDSLSEIAVQYGLDQRVSASAEVKNNPKNWTKVKGDVIEAYVAALVLDDKKMGDVGFKAAEQWLHELWTPKLDGILAERAPNLNAKDVLSRKLLSRGIKLEYKQRRPMKQLAGGQQTYFIGVYLYGWGYDGKLLGGGEGLSKTAAGNMAAEDALKNPVIESIAEQKKKFDLTTKLPSENGHVHTGVEKESTQGQIRERELVEQKRNMFMSSEFG
jgi:ribonuclease III